MEHKPASSPRKRRETSSAPPRATEELFRALDVLSDALLTLRQALEAALRAPTADVWVDQKESALRPRTHCRLARELKAKGDPRAAIISRRHLLTQAAIDEHLRGSPAPERRELPGRGASSPVRSMWSQIADLGDDGIPSPREAIDAAWRQIDEQRAAAEAWKKTLGREPTRREQAYYFRRLEKLEWLPNKGQGRLIKAYGTDLIRGDDPDAELEQELRARGLWRPRTKARQ